MLALSLALDVPKATASRIAELTGVSPAHLQATQLGLDRTLTSMQARGTHMALVTDGSRVVGAAMMEDVVERLVGEVVDAGQHVGDRQPGSGTISIAPQGHSSAQRPQPLQ